MISFCVFLYSGCVHSSLPGIYRDYTNADRQFLKIYFQYGFRNKLDTFERVFQKDLIEDGTITIPFWLTTSEQDSIQAKMNSIDFFSLPNEIPAQRGLAVTPSAGDRHLLIQLDDTHTYKLITLSYDADTTNSSCKRFMELEKLLVRIIESKPEYKALPNAHGFYL